MIKSCFHTVMFNPSVTTQQPLPLDQIDGHVTSKELFSSGPVSVRNATDSAEDREFVGKLVVEGFERKFVHATSRARFAIRYFSISVLEDFFSFQIYKNYCEKSPNGHLKKMLTSWFGSRIISIDNIKVKYYFYNMLIVVLVYIGLEKYFLKQNNTF